MLSIQSSSYIHVALLVQEGSFLGFGNFTYALHTIETCIHAVYEHLGLPISLILLGLNGRVSAFLI